MSDGEKMEREGCLKSDAKSEPQMQMVAARNPRGALRGLVGV